jgi:anti-sigma B factor antagonist
VADGQGGTETEVTRVAQSGSITTRHLPDTVLVQAAGELDLHRRGDLTDTLGRAVAHAQGRAVLVDLGLVTFIDSTVVSALLNGYAAAVRAGCPFRVVNAGGAVLRVLTMMGVAPVLLPGDHGSPDGDPAA